jgi:hypothetical protein
MYANGNVYKEAGNAVAYCSLLCIHRAILMQCENRWICSQLPFHMSIGCHCLVLVQNTHICESAIQECEASQLRDHLELVVFDWNSGNGDLDLDYVSNSESCGIHLKKPGHKHYKA